MEFEYIDEDQVELSRQTKKKMTPCLLDKPRENRTYWGKELGTDGEYHDDLGTQLAMCLAQSAIRRSIRNRILLDIDDFHLSARLNKEYRNELRQYQLYVLQELILSQFSNVSFITDSNFVTHIVIAD